MIKIKVIGKTGDVHYLNENALLLCKEEGVLVAYPINPASKIVLGGGKLKLKITDKVKTREDHKTDKGHNRPISELIDHLRPSETPILITRLNSVFKACKIVTVEDLVTIGRKRFSEYRGIGVISVRTISDALNELYGIRSW